MDIVRWVYVCVSDVNPLFVNVIILHSHSTLFKLKICFVLLFSNEKLDRLLCVNYSYQCDVWKILWNIEFKQLFKLFSLSSSSAAVSPIIINTLSSYGSHVRQYWFIHARSYVCVWVGGEEGYYVFRGILLFLFSLHCKCFQ